MKRIEQVTVTIGNNKVELIHKGCVGTAEYSGKVTNATMDRAMENWFADWATMPAKGV